MAQRIVLDDEKSSSHKTNRAENIDDSLVD